MIHRKSIYMSAAVKYCMFCCQLRLARRSNFQKKNLRQVLKVEVGVPTPETALKSIILQRSGLTLDTSPRGGSPRSPSQHRLGHRRLRPNRQCLPPSLPPRCRWSCRSWGDSKTADNFQKSSQLEKVTTKTRRKLNFYKSIPAVIWKWSERHAVKMNWVAASGQRASCVL